MRAQSRKGQLEISFNWIFILIAGAGILIFFTFLIIKETGSAEENINVNLQKRMESLLSAVEKNPASIKNIGYFTTELRFSCEERIHEFYVEGSKSRSELQSELIYAPARMGKSEIISWTLPLKAPYKISNLLLISDKKTMYIFDESVSSFVRNPFPSQFVQKNVLINNIGNIKDEGFERYIIILSNSNSNFINTINLAPSFKEKGKTTFIVLPQNQNFQTQVPSGSLRYYEYLNGVASNQLSQVGESYFVTFPLLYGAIISGSPSLYNCSTDKVIKRIRSADELNLIRVEKLRNHFSPNLNSVCSVFYSLIKVNINTKIGVLESGNFYTPAGISSFQEQMLNLILADERLLSSSCPLIGVYEGVRPQSG